jgi:2-polyprenyl-6-methoxyphenol hydroxylase-like FAD-dependent oxidoreductase
MAAEQISTRCCIGGGPAVGTRLLLARAASTWSCSRSADFLRDFRGDTIHPSTLEVMGELGLLTRSSSCRTTR